MAGTRNDVLEMRHHLAAIANTQRKRVASLKECRELVARTRMVQHRLRPAAARAQYVAERKPAAGHQPLVVVERVAPFQQIAHVHVHCGKAGSHKCSGHFVLAVDALLSQDRDARLRGAAQRTRAMSSCGSKDSATFRPGILVVENAIEFFLGCRGLSRSAWMR